MAPRDVVAIAREVLGGKLPVARHDPLVQPADDFAAALATVEERVKVPGHLAQILLEGRRLGIEGREDEALVTLELGDRDEAPPCALELAVVGLLDEGDAHEAAVTPVGPAVIGTREGGGVAGVGAAQPIAAMPADVQEGAELTFAVADHQDRVLAHVRAEEVARPRDLALVAEEEPAPGEDPLQLLLVDLALDEDTATDATVLDVHQAGDIGCHVNPPERCRIWGMLPASTVTMAPVSPLALGRSGMRGRAPARGARAPCARDCWRIPSSRPDSAKCDRSPGSAPSDPGGRRDAAGATPFTRISGPTSVASCRISPITARLDAV